MISVQELANKRGWKCEVCGHVTRCLQRNHVFHKRKKGHPEFDDERNIQLVDHRCHETVAHSYENKCFFWKIQKARYPDLQTWYDGLNLKFKERFD